MTVPGPRAQRRLQTRFPLSTTCFFCEGGWQDGCCPSRGPERTDRTAGVSLRFRGRNSAAAARERGRERRGEFASMMTATCLVWYGVHTSQGLVVLDVVFQQNQAFPATSTYYYSLRAAADVINAEDLLSPYKTGATIFLFPVFVLGVTQWLWGRRWDLPSFASSPGPPPSPSAQVLFPGVPLQGTAGSSGSRNSQTALLTRGFVGTTASWMALGARQSSAGHRDHGGEPIAPGRLLSGIILSIDQWCLCSPAVEGRAGCRVREWIADQTV